MAIQSSRLAAGVFIALMLGPISASGQDAKDTEYRRMVKEATDDYASGDFAEAHSLFERAHRLSPNARTYRGLGLCSFELRHYVVAIDELSSALSDSRKALTPVQRSEVEELLGRAKSYVGTVTLKVMPETAQVLLDGQPIRERRLTLDPGEFHLLARAEGYRDQEVRVSVTGGESQTIILAPSPLAESMPKAASSEHKSPLVAAAPAAGADSAGLSTRRTLALVTGGVGIVGVGFGTYFGLQSLSKHDQADTHCSGSTCRDKAGVDLRGQARTAGNLSTVGFIVGGVGLAAAAVLWFTAPSSSERPTDVGIGPGGVQLRGRF
jgi:hypothetical protein